MSYADIFEGRVVQSTALGFEPSSFRAGNGCDATTPKWLRIPPPKNNICCVLHQLCACREHLNLQPCVLVLSILGVAPRVR